MKTEHAWRLCLLPRFRGFALTALTFVVLIFPVALGAAPSDHWSERSKVTTERLCGVIYGQSNFVAVGYSGTILSSETGEWWEPRSSGTSVGLFSVAYGNGLFVAVGETILSSPDGISWTPRTSETGLWLETVAYVNGQFIAVGSNGSMRVSVDGTNWLARATGTTRNLYGISYGNGVYVITGAGGLIRSSVDGTNWITRTSSTTQDLNGATYAEGIFVVQGNNTVIRTSINGTNWVSATADSGYGSFTTTAYGFYRFATAGSVHIHISTDKAHWIRVFSGVYDIVLLGICAGPDTFVAVGDWGTIVQSDVFPPGGISLQPEGGTFLSGQTVTLDVSTWWPDPVDYEWRRNGTKLTDGGKFSGTSIRELTITDFTAGEEGDYTVVVSGARYGSCTSHVATLKVNIAVADPSFNPGAGNEMRAIALQPDGRILIGGSFTNVAGQSHSNIARLFPDGTLDTGFDPQPNGTVHCFAIQPDGKIIVAGDFRKIGGQLRNKIARLSPDGSLDLGFNADVNGPVYALALQPDGSAIIGGSFDIVNAHRRKNIARLDANGTLDLSLALDMAGEVSAIAVQGDGKILVGGHMYFYVGDEERDSILRLNPGGTLDASFNPGMEAYTEVNCLALQRDGKILIGGNFSTVSGQPHVGLARLNSSGSLDDTFAPQCDSGVMCLGLQADGRILAGGWFYHMDGQLRATIARLNANGILDPSFNPGTDTILRRLALQPDGKIVIGGDFNTVAGQPRKAIARLQTGEPATQSLAVNDSIVTWLRDGTSPEVWRTTFDYCTNGLDWSALGEGSRISGGWQLTDASIPPGSTVRARGSAGDSVSSWFIESMTGPPAISAHPLDVSGNVGSSVGFTVTAGGTGPFTLRWFKDNIPLDDNAHVSGASAAIVKLSGITLADQGGYTVVVSNDQGSVTSRVAVLTIRDLVITSHPTPRNATPGKSASFSVTATGSPVLAYQWRKDGVDLEDSTDTSGSKTATLSLNNVQADDAGYYSVRVSNAHDSSVSTAASLTVDLVTLDNSFNVPTEASGLLGLQPDGKTLVLGPFAANGGRPATFVARLNSDGSLDPDFAPDTYGSIRLSAVQPDGKILLLGYDLTAWGARTNLFRLQANGALDDGFDSKISPNEWGWYDMFCLALQDDNRILVGGVEMAFPGAGSLDLVRINADGSRDVGFTPNTSVDYVLCLAVEPDSSILVGGSMDLGNSAFFFGKLNPSGSAQALFHPQPNASVFSTAVQNDEKILLAGSFRSVGGVPCSGFGRLNPDGTVDLGFTPEISAPEILWCPVDSVAVQADGRIILAGGFTAVNGQPRSHLARLNPDGTLDLSFGPDLPGAINSILLQADGRLLLNGAFANPNGTISNYFARLNNTGPATETLTCDGFGVTWLRGGTAPEIWRANFEHSTNGVDWASLGAGTRIPGGWRWSGSSVLATGTIRARGVVCGGYNNSSSWHVESIAAWVPPVAITILQDTSFGFGGNKQFGFNVSGGAGQIVVIESSVDLVDWYAISTNTLGTGPLFFSDPQSPGLSQRYYRVRAN